MKNGEFLKAVIDRYELSEPVPPDVRMAMENSRRENLIRILKKDAHHAIFISAAAGFFLWIKKFSISLSIAQSAVAVSAAVVIGAGAVTVTGVYTGKKIIDYISNDMQKFEENQDRKTESTGKPVVPGILKYAVAVSQLEIGDASDDRLSEYTNMMVLDLRKIKGGQAAININSLDKNHVSDKILSISVIKLKEFQTSGNKGEYRISVKIVDINNSQVLMYASETVENERGIPDSLHRLAKKISAAL